MFIYAYIFFFFSFSRMLSGQTRQDNEPFGNKLIKTETQIVGMDTRILYTVQKK